MTQMHENLHMQGDQESDFYFSDRENQLLIHAEFPNWIQSENAKLVTIVLSEEKQRELYMLLRVKFDPGYTWERYLKERSQS